MFPQNFSTTDKVIRSALLRKLNKKYETQGTTAIIPEFSLVKESTRIDVAVVNGTIHGYELKSDKDNLLRLRNQSEAYNLIFDKVTLVVGKSHVVQSIYSIPDWWGITVAKINASNETFLLEIRKPESNPVQNILSMTYLLWKSEIVRKLIDLGCSKSIINKPKDCVCIELVSSLQNEELKCFVRQTLRHRFFNSDWRAGELLT